MDSTFITPLCSNPSTASCGRCPNAYNCSVLDTCLKVLDSLPQSGAEDEASRLRRNLQARIDSFGYDFPVGKRFCALAYLDHEARGLIDRALHAVQESQRDD